MTLQASALSLFRRQKTSTLHTVVCPIVWDLHIIQKSTKNRSLKDTATYWTLTKYGDDELVKLRAIKSRELDFKEEILEA